ncbi:hypothetical protein YB2330_003691 [Saitoella coloradoensis]
MLSAIRSSIARQAAPLRSSGVRCMSQASKTDGVTGSHMSENDPAKLEEQKQKHLKGQDYDDNGKLVDHAPGWNETLASASEAYIKADKQGDSIEEMQEKTVKHVKEHK